MIISKFQGGASAPPCPILPAPMPPGWWVGLRPNPGTCRWLAGKHSGLEPSWDYWVGYWFQMPSSLLLCTWVLHTCKFFSREGRIFPKHEFLTCRVRNWRLISEFTASDLKYDNEDQSANFLPYWRGVNTPTVSHACRIHPQYPMRVVWGS